MGGNQFTCASLVKLIKQGEIFKCHLKISPWALSKFEHQTTRELSTLMVYLILSFFDTGFFEWNGTWKREICWEPIIWLLVGDDIFLYLEMLLRLIGHSCYVISTTSCYPLLSKQILWLIYINIHSISVLGYL